MRRSARWLKSAARSLGLALACFGVVSSIAVSAGAQGAAEPAEPAPCGPFEAGPTGVVELAADRTLRDPGVLALAAADVSDATPADPSGSAAAPAAGNAPTSTATARDLGSIVPLPASDPAGAPSSSAAPGSADPAAASEALLALPKNAAGGIPTDFELGPDAKIAQSFFSPVICATVARVTGPPGTSLDQLVTVVPETGIVVPNDVYASAAAELTPAPAAANAADPYAPLQYGLALSGVRAARELGAGDGVRVALLDSPPEFAHRDLAPSRIEAIATETKGRPSVHGTLMAGVIGAAENNGFGIAGLAPKARIISIPVCTPKGGAGGQCTIYQMLQGFDHAYDAKAVLVNLSLSGPPNPLLERGVARLEELGLVVVAAAGNEGREEKRYPAAYPSVIGVGAVDREGKLFATSNRGAWVELYAPGVEVLSTMPGSAFAFGSGTSLAAAHVTGSLAVLTGITGDVKRARSELFRSVNSRAANTLPILPPACDVLRRVGRACGAAGSSPTPGRSPSPGSSADPKPAR